MAFQLVGKQGDHIELLLAYDVDWASDVVSFVKSHPQFRPYIEHTPFTPRPFGKRMEFPSDDDPQTVQDYLLYYICHTQAYTNYGHAIWHRVFRKTIKEVRDDPHISDNKKAILIPVLEHTTPLTTWEEVWKLDIKGVGMGAKRFIKGNFSDWVDTSDAHFQHGLQKIYGFSSPPVKEEVDEIVKTWTDYPRVGAVLCQQVSHISFDIENSKGNESNK
jgi:hypothetical protein